MCAWRGDVLDDQVDELVAASGWWARVGPHSLGWVTARSDDGALVGFANVAWDGGHHAFLLDPTVDPGSRRTGVGTALVAHAVAGARASGCEWLHVDFEPDLAGFYLDACGFRTTAAGLIHLPPVQEVDEAVSPRG